MEAGYNSHERSKLTFEEVCSNDLVYKVHLVFSGRARAVALDALDDMAKTLAARDMKKQQMDTVRYGSPEYASLAKTVRALEGRLSVFQRRATMAADCAHIKKEDLLRVLRDRYQAQMAARQLH